MGSWAFEQLESVQGAERADTVAAVVVQAKKDIHTAMGQTRERTPREKQIFRQRAETDNPGAGADGMGLRSAFEVVERIGAAARPELPVAEEAKEGAGTQLALMRPNLLRNGSNPLRDEAREKGLEVLVDAVVALPMTPMDELFFDIQVHAAMTSSQLERTLTPEVALVQLCHHQIQILEICGELLRPLAVTAAAAVVREDPRETGMSFARWASATEMTSRSYGWGPLFCRHFGGLCRFSQNSL
jgi:hypothetical protein